MHMHNFYLQKIRDEILPTWLGVVKGYAARGETGSGELRNYFEMITKELKMFLENDRTPFIN